jgi:hypothetical protein
MFGRSLLTIAVLAALVVVVFLGLLSTLGLLGFTSPCGDAECLPNTATRIKGIGEVVLGMAFVAAACYAAGGAMWLALGRGRVADRSLAAVALLALGSAGAESITDRAFFGLPGLVAACALVLAYRRRARTTLALVARWAAIAGLLAACWWAWALGIDAPGTFCGSQGCALGDSGRVDGRGAVMAAALLCWLAVLATAAIWRRTPDSA